MSSPNPTRLSINVSLKCLTKPDIMLERISLQDLGIMADNLSNVSNYFNQISIKNIKNALKKSHKIPEICQIYYYFYDTPILSDKTLLSDLYYTLNDEIEMHYYATAKIDEINDILGDIDNLLAVCRDKENTELLQIDDYSRQNNERNSLMHLISNQISILRRLTFRVFLPWSSYETEASKLYFVDRGGLKKLIELLEWTISFKKLSVRSQTIVDFQKDLFLAFWGFADTLQEKLILLKTDCLQFAMYALQSNTDHNLLIHHALGLTQMLMEIPAAKTQLLSYPNALRNIASCLKSRVDMVNNTNDRFPEATIISRLSHSTDTHALLTEDCIRSTLLDILIKVTENNGHIFLKYLLLQYFMNILINPCIDVLNKFNLNRLEMVLKNFYSNHTWLELYDYETQNGYNCSTIVPFVHAIFIPFRSKVNSLDNLKNAYLNVAIMSIRNVLSQEIKQKLFIQQNLLDFLIIATWYLPKNYCHEWKECIMAHFTYPSNVPTLFHICLTRQAVLTNGFSSIFSLFKT